MLVVSALLLCTAALFCSTAEASLHRRGPSPTPGRVCDAAAASSDMSDGSASASNLAASPASGPVFQTSTSLDTCTCGYRLTKYANAYFPLSHSVDFTTFTSLSDFAAHKLQVNTGWGIGGAAPDGTLCVGSTRNFRYTGASRGVQLVVPGKQVANGSTVTGAEFSFETEITGGVITASLKLDDEPGTCQAIFTYGAHRERGSDEQDIEALGASLLKASKINPPGIQLTNYDPADPSNERNSNKIDKFPFDPTTDFHNYTIAWLPKNTTYYLDGKAMSSPPKYPSVNPSLVIINNWSNGGEYFTQGPPKNNAVMDIKALTMYYRTAVHSGMPKSCKQSDVCVV